MATTTRPANASVPDPPAPGPVPVAGANDGPYTAMLREVGELVVFCAGALAALPGALRYGSLIMRQTATLVRGTSPFLFALAAFLGSSVASFGYFFLRSIGGSDALGIVTGFTDPRLAAPIIFGYAFTSKVCCGIVAEIGSMKVQQETEALEATGIDPRHYIVGTKVLATALFVPLGVAVALIGATFGSWMVSTQILQGISSSQFLELHWSVQGIGDQLKTAINIGVMAILTTLVACFYGFRVRGGPAGVGEAAARSLLVNLIVVHLVAAFFQVLFYGTDPGIPIGG